MMKNVTEQHRVETLVLQRKMAAIIGQEIDAR